MDCPGDCSVLPRTLTRSHGDRDGDRFGRCRSALSHGDMTPAELRVVLDGVKLVEVPIARYGALRATFQTNSLQVALRANYSLFSSGLQ
eukprot:974438-Rhodomonas_salina.4